MSLFTSTTEHTYRGILFKAKYPHIEEHLAAIVAAPKVMKWIDRLLEKNELLVSEILATDVNFFGEHLGFLKCIVYCVSKETGKNIASNIVVIRGDSVCVYIIVTVKETGRQYVLFVEQFRVAGQGIKTEVPAGMCDLTVEDSEILGPVFKEIWEECGLRPKKNELVQLGPKVFLSIGLLDEGVTCFLLRVTVTQAEFDAMTQNIYGEDANEEIKLLFCEIEKIDEFLNQIGDAKADICHRRYVYLTGHL